MKPATAIVSNPPYSIRWDGDANPLLINDPRFSPAGVLAPKSKADLVFIMRALADFAVAQGFGVIRYPDELFCHFQIPLRNSIAY